MKLTKLTMESMLHNITPFLPLMATLMLVIVILGGLHFVLIAKPVHLTQQQKLPRQISMLVLTLVGLVVIAMSLPVSESTRNQVIALIGVLASGVIAFSSTTMVGNLMAGLVLRVNKPFKVGDFIRVEQFSGRVAEMGLLDTEIQTDTRELVALSNTFMVNTPVTVTRGSGAVISVDLSLGYELHHSFVEKHLLTAAANAGLGEAFVQVTSLGDFSVSYRVAGLLTDVKSMLSARSRLHKAVLDSLHHAGIEIVSPTFVNQRVQPVGSTMIPQRSTPDKKAVDDQESAPEAIVYDKAEQAAEQEKSKAQLQERIAEYDAQIAAADGENKKHLKAKKVALEQQLEGLLATVPPN